MAKRARKSDAYEPGITEAVLALTGLQLELPWGAENESGAAEREARARDAGQVDVLELPGLDEASARLDPVGGGEVHHTSRRVLGQDREDLLQVQLGVEAVQLGGGDQRQYVGGAAGVLLASVAEPVDPTFHES